MSKTNKSVKQYFLDLEPFFYSNICGYETTKSLLQTTIQLPLKNPEIFIQRGLKPPKGILFYGPPGCSKTMFARALAHESSMNFISIKGPEIFNKYVGDSEKKIREIFQSAKQISPCIVFFDEIDALAKSRGDSDVSDRILT
jgi:SpoVK/Ycf46/Vps4 family AAA+-type ATPase